MSAMYVIGDPRELGAAIRAERKAQGLNQEDLALAAGTGRRFVSDVENGKPTARIGEVLGVLAALGLTVELQRRRRGGGERGDSRA